MQRFLLVATVVSSAAFTSVADQPSPSRSGAIRVICLPKWDADLFAAGRVSDVLPNALVDVSVPLADIPPDATAGAVLADAERRTRARRSDFMHTVHYLRWNDALDKLTPWAKSSTSRGSRRFVRDIQAGDVLVFHQIICYFDGEPTPRPN